MTETWTRDLLEQAGDTVTPGPPPSFERSSSSRPRRLAVAAAVVLLLAGGVTFVAQLAGDRAAPATRVRPSQPPAGGLRVPLVFGMTTQQAQSTLEASGIRVRLRQWQTCAEVEGRVIGTSPGQGRPLVGTGVTLIVSGPKDFICPNEGPRAIAWQLVDLATGRGPGPDFAPGVLLPPDVRRALARAATRFPSQVGIIDRPPGLEVRQERRYGGPDAYDLAIGLPWNGRIVPTVVVHFEIGNDLAGHPGQVVSVTLGDRAAFGDAIG
jgi:hypothetical protein